MPLIESAKKQLVASDLYQSTLETAHAVLSVPKNFVQVLFSLLKSLPLSSIVSHSLT